MCNQVCAHCHVDAGPDRKEMMSKKDFLTTALMMKQHPIETVDIIEELPEMHPDFRCLLNKFGCTPMSKTSLFDRILPSY